MVYRTSLFSHVKLPLILLALSVTGVSCSKFASDAPHTAEQAAAKKPFLWDNANVYFLLTDRFNNGNPANDFSYGRKADAAPLRGYAGGDLAGVTAKIKSGYFDKLGINVIWTTPVVEQIHAGTDEGTGKSYGFHGYWARDFTAVDANLGTMDDMREFVETAHAHGIRVLMDVVINHTGPVTEVDPVWPSSWVRTTPPCTYKDPKTTIECTLVKNLPDVRTDSNEAVELPPELVKKWKAEGRYEKEVKELDEFFAATGYPRAPRFYIMKWHADWIKRFGIDGFRVDTAKHTEATVWKELKVVASAAFEEWKEKNPGKKFSDDAFFMTGEVYGYGIGNEKKYDMGANTFVNFFDNGFNSLINFSFVHDAKKSYEEIFSSYSSRLNGSMKGYSVLNYIGSHDDSNSYDRARLSPLQNANKLLLSPGAAQLYYGDETSRDMLGAEGVGDAQLRTFMNWGELSNNITKNGLKVGDIYEHWGKLARFRQAHVAIGAGAHQMLQAQPYIFKRTYENNGISDKVVVALDLSTTEMTPINVHGVFADGQKVRDFYSGRTAVVANGKVVFASKNAVVLIEAL